MDRKDTNSPNATMIQLLEQASQRIIQPIFHSLLDLVYPDSLYCICCGKIIDSTRPYRLCNECMEEIRWATGRTCRKCGKLLSANNPLEECYSCREHEHVYDMGFTCCEYGSNPRSMLFALKYGGRTDVGITLAEIMHDRMTQIRGETGLLYDAILSVPMNPEKEKERGYNQAEIIGRSFAKREQMPYYRDVLRRVKRTPPLRGMTPAERKQLLTGVMAVPETEREKIAGKDLLLIDDIYTTGATMDAATEVLLDAGAERVYIFTFAAGADVVKSE
jgi:competence protein ComFC